MLSNLADWVTDVIDRLGYVGVALLVALENLFPPIPSEIVLPFAGFVARDGRATLLGMILAATIGSVVGAWVLYGISAAIGPERFHHFVVRYGKWFRLTSADITKAERWFDKRAVRRRAARPVRAARALAGVDPGRVPADALRHVHALHGDRQPDLEHGADRRGLPAAGELARRRADPRVVAVPRHRRHRRRRRLVRLASLPLPGRPPHQRRLDASAAD